MEFIPYPKQEQFIKAVLNPSNKFIIYGGAMGGGKTFVSLATLIILCKFYPNSKWIVIRDSLPTLKRTTLPSFEEVLPKEFVVDHNQQEQKYTFKNGSQILFMAEDYPNDKDFDKFKGLACNGFLLEQIEELHEGLLDVCMIRAGRHRIDNQPRAKIMATVNPTQTWVKEKIYQRYISGTLPEGWVYIPASIFDNPALAEDKEYMRQFDNLDPVTKSRLIDGNWDAFEVKKPFLYCFDERKHISDVPNYNPKQTIYLSFDFNVDPSTCVIWQEGFRDNKPYIHIIDEVYLNNSNIFEVCEVIKTKYGEAHKIITGDASGMARHHMQKGNVNTYTLIKQELALMMSQIKVPAANPPINERRTLVNSMLSKHGELLIHSRCKHLIEDLKFTQVDEEGRIDNKSNKHRGHLLDAFCYALYNFHPNFITKGF